MARIINDDQGGQSGSSSEGQLTVMQADGQSHITLPEGDFMAKGDILRDGQDLILQSSDGSEVVIEGYFSAMPAPVLTTPQGSMLTPELVQSFVKSEGNVELAANETGNDASAVGIIKEVSGDATITHTDGTSEKVTLGMAVHQGDIVETTAQGAVNIVFLDESSFAVSNNARLAIDEYVFDPATQSGETNVSILRGMFVFTSGLIGRDDPDDVQIETPVGSIGIRGTTIAGHINPDGESQITVVEGAIVIKNASTTVTLAEQYETVKLTGYEAPIQMVGTLDANQMQTNYGMVGTVNAGFFNTLNTEPADSEAQDNPADAATDGSTEAPADAQPADTQTDAPIDAAPQQDVAPVTDPTVTDPAATDPATEGQLETEQPVVASYDVHSDPLASSFDTSVALKPAEPFSPTSSTTTAITGANTTTAPVTSTAPLAPVAATAPAAPAGNNPPPTTSAPASTAPALLPLELVVDIKVDDDALSGDVVGRVFTTVSFPDVQMRFLNVPLEGGDPIFELVMEGPGVYKVVLTDAGETMTSTATLGTALGSVEVLATLPDGRTNTAVAPASFGDFSNQTVVVTPPPVLNLNGISGAEGYSMTGGAGSGIGNSAAYLGDFDRNGTNNFAMTTDAAAGNVLINGLAAITKTGDSADMQIAGGGDVNGDGKLDFVTGRGYFDNGGDNDIGQVNIHNGANPTAASFSNGVAASDLFGSSVAMTDFNGDGYADVFAGAQTAGGLLGQVSYFSGNSGFGFSSAPFTGLDSGAGGDQLGLSMTSLSDYNNDGFGDLAVGGNGFVNIYLGGSTYNGVADFTIAAPIDTTTYDLPLFNLGDIDGDGRSDLMIGATGANGNAGSAYISLGGSGVVSFTIDPAAGEEIAGGGSAGDFNGDGYDDIFIATRNGNMVDGYVIYGGTSLSDITLDPSWMTNNPGAGFHMTLNLNGLLANPTTDHVGLMATSIGDQNGDGFEDLLLSSSEINNGAGGAYIVYGRADPYDLAAPDPEVHTDAGPNANAGFDMISSSNNDGLVGSAANNIMANLNGSNIHTGVSFQAGGGNDIIRLYGTGNGVARAIDGGAGRDELHLFTTGTIDLRNVSEMNSVEEIAFQGAATQNLTLGLNDIFSLMQSSSELIDADGAGALTPRYSLMITNDGTAGTKALTIDNPNGGATMATAGFTINGTYNDGSSTYDIYTFGGGYQLLIEQNISVTVN